MPRSIEARPPEPSEPPLATPTTRGRRPALDRIGAVGQAGWLGLVGWLGLATALSCAPPQATLPRPPAAKAPPPPSAAKPTPVPRDAPHGEAKPTRPVPVRVLAINDFHGQLGPAGKLAGRPVGGAAVLAAYLRAEMSRAPDATLLVHAGDMVGASPPSSALLQDEPTIEFLNGLAGPGCRYEERRSPACNVVGTLGNHDFDEGRDELMRLIRGGNHSDGPYLQRPYRGARFPYICANVIDEATGQPLLPPSTVVDVAGLRMGFIGVVLRGTPRLVMPSSVEGLRFVDEATAINEQARLLQRRGVQAIGVLLHQGGGQKASWEPTTANARVSGAIVEIATQVADSVDFIVSGHRHKFTNALLPNASGHEILVTQALSAGKAFARIDLLLDPATGDVVEKSAEIVRTFADRAPGSTPDPSTATLVSRAEQRVVARSERIVGRAAKRITRRQNGAGESALGNLIADAQRAALGSDIALTNRGGIRKDLEAGDVTWGELFAIQPFGNGLVELRLTGEQLLRLLNDQWSQGELRGILASSGLTYAWREKPARGQERVVEARVNGKPLERLRTYTVAVSTYVAAGGGAHPILRDAPRGRTAPSDLQALVDYVAALPEPIVVKLDGRVRKRK